MARNYSVSEIEAACAVMEAISNGLAVDDVDNLDDEIIHRASLTSQAALRIMQAGLREIEAEHNRQNGEVS